MSDSLPEEEARDAERKRRLALAFGEALPETTADERADASSHDMDTAEEWLRRQVPPHHG